jgi:hypothetical protein
MFEDDTLIVNNLDLFSMKVNINELEAFIDVITPTQKVDKLVVEFPELKFIIDYTKMEFILVSRNDYAIDRLTGQVVSRSEIDYYAMKMVKSAIKLGFIYTLEPQYSN